MVMWNVVAKEYIGNQHLTLTRKQCQMQWLEIDLTKLWNTYTAMIQKILSNGDRCAKIKPLIEKLNEYFMKYQPTEKKADVDESMVPYFGSYVASIKQALHKCTKNHNHMRYSSWYIEWHRHNSLFCYSYASSCSLCERKTSFCTGLISTKLCRFLLIFLTSFTSLSVFLLFPLSITFFIIMQGFWFYFT